MIIKNPILTSAVAAALRYIVNEPDEGTITALLAVVSFVLIVGNINELVVTKLFVTTTDVPAVAILTVPDGLFITWSPVVPGVVIVLGSTILPPLVTLNLSATVEASDRFSIKSVDTAPDVAFVIV